MIEDQIKKAKEWWMNALRKPSFKCSNDDPKDKGAVVAEFLASSIRAKEEQIPEEKIMIFGDTLEKILTKICGPLSNDDDYFARWGFVLSVDYHPDIHLETALKDAGIEANITSLPWKTHMRIKNDSVEVVTMEEHFLL